MLDFPTRAQFRAGLRRAARRRAATERKLFGPRRQATLPVTELDPATVALLDEVAAEMHDQRPRGPYGHPQTEENKRWLNLLFGD